MVPMLVSITTRDFFSGPDSPQPRKPTTGINNKGNQRFMIRPSGHVILIEKFLGNSSLILSAGCLLAFRAARPARNASRHPAQDFCYRFLPSDHGARFTDLMTTSCT